MWQKSQHTEHMFSVSHVCVPFQAQKHTEHMFSVSHVYCVIRHNTHVCHMCVTCVCVEHMFSVSHVCHMCVTPRTIEHMCWMDITKWSGGSKWFLKRLSLALCHTHTYPWPSLNGLPAPTPSNLPPQAPPEAIPSECLCCLVFYKTRTKREWLQAWVFTIPWWFNSVAML